ncbi:MAG: hypothetical protein Q8R67_05255 [Rhodoferax sp.]|nr:hypothetical protein [Rhodoferax sp.]MDP3651074.1 hypothetical protein [Rhodoferax sp.]
MNTTPKPNTNVRIKFGARHLPRLALFMATHDIRYYLNGIRIERAEIGGIYLVACDGHTLAVIHDKDGSMEGVDGDGVIMRASPGLVQACKITRRLRSAPGGSNVIVTGARVSVANDFDQENSDFELFVQPGTTWIEGVFPNWRKVLPDFEKLQPGFASQVNGGYLARYSKMNSDQYVGLVFWSEGKDGPVVVQHNDLPEMISIIMPIRWDACDETRARRHFKQSPVKAIPVEAPLPEQQPSDAAPLGVSA